MHSERCMPVQEQPPGMHIITLPFADDLRHPEKDPSFVGTTQVLAESVWFGLHALAGHQDRRNAEPAAYAQLQTASK